MNNQEELEKQLQPWVLLQKWIFALSTACDIEQMPGLNIQMLNCYYIISRKHISVGIHNYSVVINVHNAQKTVSHTVKSTGN